MFSRYMTAVLVAVLCFEFCAAVDIKTNAIENDASDVFGFGQCEDNDTSISCQSIRIARNVLQQLIHAKKSDGIGDIKIAEGVELVRSKSMGDGGREIADGTFLGRMAKFLHSHEFRVKLPELLGKEKLDDVISQTLSNMGEQSKLVETGRKKGKGDGGVLLMGMMMAKMLAAIGMGGVGMLTMKALMVSAMALMLSAIVAVKKLASSGDDHDGGHQVHYVSAGGDHHRRKRSYGEDEELPPSPYRGWAEYVLDN